MIWLDAARVVAIMAVVILHVAGSVVTLSAFGSPHWWQGNLYDALVRWCVPVFVMVSGALLLDPRKTDCVADFYRKRAARVLLPIAFWSGVYILWNHRGALAQLRAMDVVHSIARGWPHYHLWFLYMIMCLYLFVPFLRTLVVHTRRCDLWWLVALMFVLSGVNEWYRTFTGGGAGLFINWFLPYLPYFLCGYLIQTSERKVPLSVSLGVFGAAVGGTAMGCYGLGKLQGLERGLYFYGYLSVFVVPMSVSAMLMLRQWKPAGMLARGIQRVSALTLGVYLVHPILLESLRAHVLKPEDYLPLLSVPFVAALVFGGSLVVALIFHRTPFLNRLI
jgi:surface polysaccharide O-acyltransferase-like enzyme